MNDCYGENLIWFKHMTNVQLLDISFFLIDTKGKDIMMERSVSVTQKQFGP